MADQRRDRNRREDASRRHTPDEGLNDGCLWFWMKLAFLVLIVALATTAYHRFSTAVSQKINLPDIKPGTGHSNFKSKDGGGQAEHQYQSEMAVMKRVIAKYSSMQKSGGNNETGEGFGKSTGSFLLETEESQKEALEEKEEVELDEVDLTFVDDLLHDIHETDESKKKVALQSRVNELEAKLGRKITKYHITPDELDADMELDDDKRQYFEFLNVRQGFVNHFIKRMRELKSENPQKYSRTPDDYTMTQKFLLLRKSFTGYVDQVWDNDLKRMKRLSTKTPASHVAPQAKHKGESDSEDHDDKENEIDEILHAIHWTPKCELRQNMEEELEKLKSMQGHPLPKVNNKEHIKNNFIYAERDKLVQMAEMRKPQRKRSPADYSFMEKQELKAAWEGYYQFYNREHDDSESSSELTLGDLDEVDDLIDAIEQTPRYIEKIRNLRNIERLDKLHVPSEIYGNDEDDTDEPSPLGNFAEALDERINALKKLREDFILEERSRILGSSTIASNDKKEKQEHNHGSYEDIYDEFDDLDTMRSYREPEEYSLKEKGDLKKRYDLFERRYLSKTSFNVIPIPAPSLSDLNSDALENNKLDFLDDLIEDIHQIPSPAHEARLSLEALLFAKTAGVDRMIELQREKFQMRRKFIAEERGRLVGALTKSKTPMTYTFDEKEELRCRWVDFYAKHWTMDKRSELNKLQQARNGDAETSEEEDEGDELSVDEWELAHSLIDEILDQNDFKKREKLAEGFHEEIKNERKIKEQLIRHQEIEVTAEDKIIHEFGQTSLKEFLQMRKEFILEERQFFIEKTAGPKQFLLQTSDMINLMKRWRVKFTTYKEKVDRIFQTLGTRVI